MVTTKHRTVKWHAAAIVLGACVLTGVSANTAEATGTQPAAAPNIPAPEAGYPVENYIHPNAQTIAAATGVFLKEGDGHLMHTDCTNNPDQIRVSSRVTDHSGLCFTLTGSTGWLTMEIPASYGVRAGKSHNLTVTTTDNGHTETRTITKGARGDIRNAIGDATVLVELRVKGASPASAHPSSTPSGGTPPTDNQNVVKILTGHGSCTGALVDPYWVATVASCFSPAPAQYATLAAGKPASPVKVLFGTDAAKRESPGTGVEEIRPYENTPSRDLLLVKLAAPNLTITPLKLATTPPTPNETLDFTGWGRTKTVWVPETPHTAQFSTDTVGTNELIVTNSTGTSLCAGDSGAPGTRTTPHGPELVALVSRSHQKNCLGSRQTHDGGYASRIDDITGWINDTIDTTRTINGIANSKLIHLANTAHPNMCLTVKDRTVTAGNHVIMVNCETVFQARKWELVQTETDKHTFLLRNYSSKMCLTTTGNIPDNALRQESCTPTSTAQHWQFTTTGTNTVAIRNTANNLVLNTPPTIGQSVTQTPYTGQNNNHWTVKTVGDALHNIAPIGSHVSIRSIAEPADWSIHNHNGEINLTHITTTSTEEDRKASTWKLVPGLADQNCYSFESTVTPGTYLTRTDTARITLSRPTNTPFTATWCPEKAAHSNGISFSNHHDMFRLIRNADNRIWAGAEPFGGQPHADNPTKYRKNTAWTLSDPWVQPTDPRK